MTKRSKEQDREKQEKFLQDIAAVFKRHEDVSSRFALAELENVESSESAGTKTCVKWGIDPIDNKEVCLKWV